MSTNPRTAASAAARAAWLALAATGLLAAGAALAQRPTQTIEECLESGTDLVRLPGVAGGSLSVSECTGCPAVRLAFDGRTRYYIGDEAVPYALFRETASKGNVRLYVFYRPATRAMTRLRLAAVPNAQ